MRLLRRSGIRAVLSVLFLSVFVLYFGVACAPQETKSYEETWSSLRKYPIPQWLRDGKFGIYTHWGPYAVHGQGPNGTWYSFAVYEEDGWQRKHFEENFGKLTPDFGYKDLIPMFTGENFDAEEWADLFERSGARFAGPVAEHHDGFAMWDTKYSEWNAAKMGPKRDIVGELEKAIKAKDMKYVTAFHHAANWFFFPTADKKFDTGNPKYSGLYGGYRDPGEWPPNQEFTDEWYGKIIEVIDNYDPDFIWFDFGLDFMPDTYIKRFLAYYYNNSVAHGDQVVVTYKGHDLPPGVGLMDLELGQEKSITYHEWITDSSIDDQGAWSFVPAAKIKSVNRLVDNLVDRVAKNGYLLLNVGPAPNGSIPQEAQDALLGIGAWLDVNGEAIYETTPWIISGEGSTSLEDKEMIGFNESDIAWTAEDIRFTTKDNVLYATFLDWPGEEAVIRTLAGFDWGGEEEEDDEEEEHEEEEDIDEEDEEEYESELAEVLHELREEGKFNLENVLNVIEEILEGESEDEEEADFVGLYNNEITSVTMLGVDKPLEWELTKRGLVVKTPDIKPCEHAFVLKIERGNPF